MTEQGNTICPAINGWEDKNDITHGIHLKLYVTSQYINLKGIRPQMNLQ